MKSLKKIFVYTLLSSFFLSHQSLAWIDISQSKQNHTGGVQTTSTDLKITSENSSETGNIAQTKIENHASKVTISVKDDNGNVTVYTFVVQEDGTYKLVED